MHGHDTFPYIGK